MDKYIISNRYLSYDAIGELSGYKTITLHRIQAKRNIPSIGVSAGDFGGYVESYDNLSQEGDCWIFDNSKVYAKATIKDDAIVMNNSEIANTAVVRDKAIIENSRLLKWSEVRDKAIVRNQSQLYGALIKDDAVIDRGDILEENCVIGGDTCIKHRQITKRDIDNKTIFDSKISSYEIRASEEEFEI